METIEYVPNGVCSKKMVFKIENNIIKSFDVIGGCSGNLQGIKALVKGMKLTDIKSKLKGIKCGFKNTSCPDQIANAIDKYLEGKNENNTR